MTPAMRAAQRKGRAPRAGQCLAAPGRPPPRPPGRSPAPRGRRRSLRSVPAKSGDSRVEPPRHSSSPAQPSSSPPVPAAAPAGIAAPRLAVLTAGRQAKRSRREPVGDRPAAAVQPRPGPSSVALGGRWRHPPLEPGTALVVAGTGTEDLRSVSEFASQLANKVGKRCLRVTGP